MQSTTRTLVVIASVVLFSGLSGQANAQWDPTRIQETKDAAEAAYAAGDYSAAVLHYVELRSILKSALEAGEVPSDTVEGVTGALHATTYQLGRSNQLSENCDGAVLVYQELLTQDASALSILTKARYRMAETRLCLAEQATTAGNYETAAQEIREARQQLAVLASLLRDQDDASTAELVADSLKLEGALATAQTDALDKLTKDAHWSVQQKECERAKSLLDVGQQTFAVNANTPGSWQVLESDYQSICVAKTAKADDHKETPPVVTDENSDLGWLSWVVVGAGGATLLAASITDAVVSAQITQYEDLLATCRAGVVTRCEDARAEYRFIGSKPDVVLALYVSGGIVTAGGLAWALYELTSGDDESAQVGLVPTSDGLMGQMSWRF